MTEEQLAQRDERREAIDRIAARHPGLDAQGIVEAIRDGLELEMSPLVEVEILAVCDADCDCETPLVELEIHVIPAHPKAARLHPRPVR